MTVNQILVACLIAVLIAFVVVVARMATQAIDLMKKSKVLIGKGNDALDLASSKVDEVTDGVMSAVNGVIADTSMAVKAVAFAGVSLTAFHLGKGILRGMLGRTGFLTAASAKRERRRASREIKLSQKTIRELNKKARAERKAFENAEKEGKRLRQREVANAKKEARIAAAEAKLNEKIRRKESKAAAKAAAAAAVIAARTLKAEKKASAKAAKVKQAMEAKALKAEKAAAAAAIVAARKSAKKEEKSEKKSLKKASKKDKKSARKNKKAEKKRMKKLAKRNRRDLAKAEKLARKAAAAAARKAAKKAKKAA